MGGLDLTRGDLTVDGPAVEDLTAEDLAAEDLTAEYLVAEYLTTEGAGCARPSPFPVLRPAITVVGVRLWR